MNQKECKCGNAACVVRLAGGFTPFCSMQVPVTKRADGVFSSYSAAQTSGVSGRIKCVTVSGGPKRFAIVQ